MKIIPLSEGSFTIDKTKKFIPFDTDNDNLQERPIGSLLVEVQPFVVITAEDVLLLDTGLGFPGKEGGTLQLYDNLARQGILPGDITKVLLTHLHKDHAGAVGLPVAGGGETVDLAFPRATYYVQRAELEQALEKPSSSYIREDIACLENNPQVHLLEGDGVIDGYIRYALSGGHSPFHQVFWIVDGGETVFFGGDEAPQLQQMKSRFVAKYDFDGRKAMELRQTWWEEGRQEGWIFLFYHDIKTPYFPQD